MENLDELKKKYEELGAEIKRLEDAKVERKAPPKGWPVLVYWKSGSEVCSIYNDGITDGDRDWKYHTLPDGRELSPENFGKGGHKVELKKVWDKYSMRIDGSMETTIIDYLMAHQIAGDELGTIGNEWLEV